MLRALWNALTYKPRPEEVAKWLDPRTRMDAMLDPDAAAHASHNSENWMRDDYPWGPLGMRKILNPDLEERIDQAKGTALVVVAAMAVLLSICGALTLMIALAP